VALGLVIAGLTAVFSGGLLLITAGTAGSTPASADRSADHTEWVDQGDPVLTHEDVAPGPSTDTERWLPVGEPTRHVTVEATEDEVVIVGMQHYSLKGNSGIDGEDVPVFPADYWTPNTEKEPHLQGKGDPATWYPVDPATEGLHYTSSDEPDPKDGDGNGAGNRDWFYFEVVRQTIPGTAEVSHLDHLWQKQVRTVVTPPVVTPPVVEPPEVAPAEVPPRCPEPWPWPGAEEPTKGPQATEQAAPEVLGEQASAPAQQASAPAEQGEVPTVVDAGYAGEPSGAGGAPALLVGGLLLLTSAGAVAAARRT
jgi:hypothetical protein